LPAQSISVQQALWEAIRRLKAAGVDSPRLDGEVLLGHLLGVSRAALLTHPERSLSPSEEETYYELIRRRARREPLPYLTGHCEFYGLDFLVNPHVLIPRPETELLVEEALIFARALPGLALADVGAGSGAVAVALAVHLPGAIIYAIDISREALAMTGENARRHGVEERIRLLAGDLLDPLPRPVHLIAANPPYLSAADLEAAPPEVSRYEPRVALDGGVDGLGTIRRLLERAGKALLPSGALFVEIGATQGTAVCELARRNFPGASVRLRRDYAGQDRLLVVITPE
jgi:release factor glutamine methyltransferase